MTCEICTERYTKTTRKQIECPSCEYSACNRCYKEYLKNSVSTLCMNPECTSVLSETFIYDNFPMTFVKGDYKDIRTNRLMDEEKGMMPATISIMENRDRVKRLTKEISELQTLLYNKKNELWRFKGLTRDERDNEAMQSESSNPQTFLKRCPTNDCRGYLNARYTCSICETVHCSKCFEEKTEDHICDPETLKTVQLIRKDTKTCPNCSILIHKLEGCNQMYCVSCHIAFEWKTLRIITGNIHNPHYYEYLRTNNRRDRNINDIPCGGLPNLDEIHRIVTSNEVYGDIVRIIRFAGELRDYIIPHNTPKNDFKKNLDLRIMYMKKMIGEGQFKRRVALSYTRNFKTENICQILVTTATLLEDQVRNMLVTLESDEQCNVIEECSRILTYINTCFVRVEKRFKVALPRIIYRRNVNKIGIISTYIPPDDNTKIY